MPEPAVLCHHRGRLLRLCRDPVKLYRRPYLGLFLVERQRAVADLPDRLPDVLPGLVLGARHEKHPQQGHYRQRDFRCGRSRHYRLWLDSQLALGGTNKLPWPRSGTGVPAQAHRCGLGRT